MERKQRNVTSGPGGRPAWSDIRVFAIRLCHRPLSKITDVGSEMATSRLCTHRRRDSRVIAVQALE